MTSNRYKILVLFMLQQENHCHISPKSYYTKSNSGKQKKNENMTNIILGITLVALTAVGLYFLFKEDKKNSPRDHTHQKTSKPYQLNDTDILAHNTAYKFLHNLHDHHLKLYNNLMDRMIDVQSESLTYQEKNGDSTSQVTVPSIALTLNGDHNNEDINNLIGLFTNTILPENSNVRIGTSEFALFNLLASNNNDNLVLMIRAGNQDDPSTVINIFNKPENKNIDSNIKKYTLSIDNNGAMGGLANNQCGIASFLHAITEKLFLMRHTFKSNDQDHRFIDRAVMFLRTLQIFHIAIKILNGKQEKNVNKDKFNDKKDAVVRELLIQYDEIRQIEDIFESNDNDFYETVYTIMNGLYLSLNQYVEFYGDAIGTGNAPGTQLDISEVLYHIEDIVNQYINNHQENLLLKVKVVGNQGGVMTKNIPVCDDKGLILEPLWCIPIKKEGGNINSGHFIVETSFLSEEIYNAMKTAFESYIKHLKQKGDTCGKILIPVIR